jgi:general secretion pathway protein F
MRYELKAIAPSGQVESLDFQAPDEAVAVKTLEGRGYTVLSVRTRRSLGPAWRRAGERFPVALFSQELRALLGAGLPLVEAIDTLAQKEKRDESRAILLRVVTLLREGRPLSTALEEFPQAC